MDVPGESLNGREFAEGERLMHFTELVKQVKGDEGSAAFLSLIDAVRAPEDYGAYESLHNALWRFPPEILGPQMVRALPQLIERMGQFDQVERFLVPLAGWGKRNYAPVFLKALNAAPSEEQQAIRRALPNVMADLEPRPTTPIDLTGQVGDRMIPASEIACVSPDYVFDLANMPEALQRFPFLIVVDARSRPVGHVALADLVARAAERIKVARLMRFANNRVPATMDVSEIADWLSEPDASIREVVDEEGRFLGAVCRSLKEQ